MFLSHPKSQYGHVALLMRIGGVYHIRTTNSAVGRPVTQPLSLWTKSYGYTLLGWTEDLNGVHVASPRSTGSSKWLKQGSKGSRVKALQSQMRAKFPAYRKWVNVRRGELLDVDGSFGPQMDAWVKEFQRRTGLKRDGSVGPATTARLAQFGIKF